MGRMALSGIWERQAALELACCIGNGEREKGGCISAGTLMGGIIP